MVTKPQQLLNNDNVAGKLRCSVPLSAHTTWRVGGLADYFFEPADVNDLATFLHYLPASVPVFWLGLGSNLLIRDGGIRGVVICLGKGLGSQEITPDGTMRVEAGVPCAKVARMAALAGYAGVEFLAGIPGTMGGALAMNAGAFGGETWERVVSVETIDRGGQRRIRLASEYQIRYREVSGVTGEWFVAARLRLTPDPDRQSPERIKRLLAQRARTQPMGLPSCGSVFRNPQGHHAAKLIERSGLKGYQIGAARVSERHANFIINLGQATAADIEAIIRQVQAVVRSIHGINLTPEVKILGEPVIASADPNPIEKIQ